MKLSERLRLSELVAGNSFYFDADIEGDLPKDGAVRWKYFGFNAGVYTYAQDEPQRLALIAQINQDDPGATWVRRDYD